MKAVIVDLQGRYAAALNEDGAVVRIADADYELGQEIELHEVRHRSSRPMRRIATIAAAAVLVMSAGIGTAYAMPYGTVSLDAASSIEYTINRFDYVLGVKALNEEAETVLSEIGEKSLRHHRIGDALATTVSRLEEDGYLDEAETVVEITAVTKSERHSGRLQQQLETGIEDSFGHEARQGHFSDREFDRSEVHSENDDGHRNDNDTRPDAGIAGDRTPAPSQPEDVRPAGTKANTNEAQNAALEAPTDLPTAAEEKPGRPASELPGTGDFPEGTEEASHTQPPSGSGDVQPSVSPSGSQGDGHMSPQGGLGSAPAAPGGSGPSGGVPAGRK